MKFFIKNAAGFSMVQGLIVAGIVAGSSLVTTRLMNDQKKTQKTAEVKDKLEELHQTIYSTLQHKQNCKQTILANGLQVPIVTNSALPLTNIQAYDSGSARLVAVTNQKYMNNTISIKSMNLSAPPLNEGTRTLTISYEKISSDNKQTGKRIYGGNSINKTITLRIQKNPSGNTFSSCYAITAPGTEIINNVASSETGNDITKEMCGEMVSATGQKIFKWNEERSLCELDAKCPSGQIYTGIDSTGEVKCKNIKDWMNFNDIIDDIIDDPTLANCPINANVGFFIDNTTKKVSIKCNACTTSCDCPNSTDVCESNVCVNRSVGCINGTFSRGDAACMYKCIGGYWACPFPNVTCM